MPHRVCGCHFIKRHRRCLISFHCGGQISHLVQHYGAVGSRCEHLYIEFRYAHEQETRLHGIPVNLNIAAEISVGIYTEREYLDIATEFSVGIEMQ